jgi:hypothetical protein
MTFTIEETLLSGDLASDYKPHMVWREFLLGVSKRKVFLGLVLETDVLVGKVGTKISVPAVSAGFSATSITEASLDTSGFSPTDITTTDTDISIGNIIYVAFRLSTVLGEDMPAINWLRANLQKCADAIMDYIDGAIRDVLIAGVGNSVDADTGGTLAFADIADIKRLLEADSWFVDDGIPSLVIHPDQQYDILVSTTFTETIRYQQGSVPFAGNLGGPLVPVVAGVKVIVSDNMTPALAVLVTPQTHRFGPNTIFAWKRRYTVEQDREVLYGRDLYVASVRYGSAVVQANAIGLISNA